MNSILLAFTDLFVFDSLSVIGSRNIMSETNEKQSFYTCTFTISVLIIMKDV